MSARLHLENPMTVQRGYALRRSTASACQGERYVADKAGAGTDLERAAHPYQGYICMRIWEIRIEYAEKITGVMGLFSDKAYRIDVS